AQVRPSRVHIALRTAMDCYRRGDYELAATFFQQAQAGQDDLNVAERKDLSTWLQLNSTAVYGRKEGTSQLRDAQQALREGRTQEAITLLKNLTPNQQFLTGADKQTVQQLMEQLMPGGGPSALQLANSESSTGAARARTMLRQARAL